MKIAEIARQSILERSGDAQDGRHSQRGSAKTKAKVQVPALWADLMEKQCLGDKAVGLAVVVASSIALNPKPERCSMGKAPGGF